MNSITLKAPAKLNLFLKVKNRRRDGYHNIQTVFEKIDLYDSVRLAKRRQGIFLTVDKADLPGDEKNLAYRAAVELMRASKQKFGLAIRIGKNIPIAAGLGGGSSNAAAVLVGANRLFRLGHRRAALLRIARKLGADVAFFVSPYHRAAGTGRGDQLRGLKIKQRYHYLLVNPGVAVSTAGVYRRHRKAVCLPSNHRIQDFIGALDKGDFEQIETGLFNDLQAGVVKKYPRLRKIINALKGVGALNPIITGSGPVVFNLVKTEKEARMLKAKLVAGLPDLDIKTVRSYNR